MSYSIFSWISAVNASVFLERFKILMCTVNLGEYFHLEFCGVQKACGQLFEFQASLFLLANETIT